MQTNIDETSSFSFSPACLKEVQGFCLHGDFGLVGIFCLSRFVVCVLFWFFFQCKIFQGKKSILFKKIIASSFVIGEAQSSITVFELSSC